MRNLWLGHGNLLDRTSRIPRTQSEADRKLLPLDVSHIWKRRLSLPPDEKNAGSPVLETGHGLHALYFLRRICKRHPLKAPQHVSLGLQQEPLALKGSHPSGLCAGLVHGGAAI